MGLSINNNIAALNSYRNLSTTQNDLSKSLEKLSSGLRINRAADDAAGLAISEGLRAQIGGTKQAVRNAQDGISVVQTAEGALTETHSILQRMRTLAVQASNDGGLSTNAKKNIQDEIGQLQTELTRIADTTQFNGTKLLNGTYNGSFHVGANTSAQDQIKVAISQGVSAQALGVDTLDVQSASAVGATAYSAEVDLAGAAPTSSDIVVGSTTYSLDLSAWNADGDAAAAEANHTLLRDAMNSAFAAQGGALSANVDAYGNVSISGAAAGETVSILDTATAAESTTTATGAVAAIDSIDNAIKTVSSLRSELGAVQNRFDHTINNLNVAVENLSASESRIRDTDMAQEMVSFTRSQILSQAGTAMLAQAKNLPQSVLSLLQ